MAGTSLLDRLSALDDPRQAWSVVCPLPQVLLIVLCGTMAGAQDFAEIERWARRRSTSCADRCPSRKGFASHDTANDVTNAPPAALFRECVAAWIEALRDHDPQIVAIDGRTSRRAKRDGGQPLHLVSAWASRRRLVLEAVAGKGNEITAIPPLLERLEPTGARVTIDAIGRQHAIADAICKKGADDWR